MKTISLLLPLLFTCSVFAQNIELPAPDKSGGVPLMTAISERKSTRSYADKSLTPQQISDILWVAAGTSRGDKRTVPSASNHQEVSIYVLLKEGSYRYDEKTHTLVQIESGDTRALAGSQSFVRNAGANLVYVFDEVKAGGNELLQREWAAVSAGAMTQNISLYCASEQLGTVVRGTFDRVAIAKALRLNEKQIPIMSQTIGVLINGDVRVNDDQD